MYDQRLTSRLMEIATEGKGAVLNEYVAPESDESDADATESVADSTEAPDEDDVSTESEATASAKADADESTGESGPAGSVAGDGSSACPDEFPIKGNADSMIYHVEGDSSYGKTIPEFCFASSDAAEAAGYRPTASSAKPKS